jgi:hypothetical protein
MTRIDPNSFAQNWLQGMQLGTGIAERRADFQNRYAMQDEAARRDARNFEFQQQEFANRQAQQTAQADRWQQDFQRSTDNDMWNQMAQMRDLGLRDEHLALAQKRQAEAEAQAQAEGEMYRNLNRQLLRSKQPDSMLVPEGSPSFADPMANTVENGHYSQQSKLFDVLRSTTRRRQFEGILQMVLGKKLSAKQLADPEMQALVMEAESSNDPSRLIGKLMDLQREGQLRAALTPATVTGAVDGPASPEEAQLGQLVEGFDRATINDLGQKKYEQAEGLGKYAPGKKTGLMGGVDPSDPAFESLVQQQFTIMRPKYGKNVTDKEVDAMARDRVQSGRIVNERRATGSGEDKAFGGTSTKVTMKGSDGSAMEIEVPKGEGRKLPWAKGNPIADQFRDVAKDMEAARKTSWFGADEPPEDYARRLDSRARRAASLAGWQVEEPEEQAPEQQAPAEATGPGKLTDAEIDEMLARGMTTEQIEAIDAQR